MKWQRLKRRTAALAGLALLAVALALAAADRPPEGAPEAVPGVAVTRGAAPGYVPDRACATCHAAIAQSYETLGMARSFSRAGRPAAGRALEDFGKARLDHPASHQSFALERRGDRLVFKRWQVAADGRPIHTFERQVDWVVGSGNHARVYLYRTEEGELYQLPLAWYSQEGRWGMAPGYDRPDHEGVLRRVRRECLFCHNAYPEVAAGSDAYGAPQVYPERLPEGIGCQRCHGPGGEHVARASGGVFDRATIRAAIVNPARLAGPLGDDVCNQCHLQPEVALPMVRRFGRGDYSFHPGEPLPDYVVHADLSEEGKDIGSQGTRERFEINHHAYRLRQSRCFAAGAAPLHCWTCHDPHRKLPREELAVRVRAACQTCHAPAGTTTAAVACKRPGKPAGPDTADCASCHMPKRRPQDVVHVVMTDHKIQRGPGGPELTAPRPETDPDLRTVRLYAPERAPAGDLGKIYLTLSVVRAGSFPSAVERLEGLLATARPADPTPALELATAEIKDRRPAAAERTLAAVLAGSPDHPLALAWMSIARAGLGRPAEAEELLKKALDRPGADRVEDRFNLGLLLAGQGRPAEAIPLFEQAIAARFNFVAAWVHLGQAAAKLERLDRAAECYRRALEIDPAQTDAYLGLGQVLARQGKGAEARRVLTHGATVAKRPEAVAAALAALPPEPCTLCKE
jgi:Tfp pilus assembly protein PilF